MTKNHTTRVNEKAEARINDMYARQIEKKTGIKPMSSTTRHTPTKPISQGRAKR